jgi:SAM-dependent methyltransferase
MEDISWYEREEDWVLKRSIIFSKKMVQFTFLEVDRLIRLLGGLPTGARILDLCCGIGRHSLALARKGFSVTGVDITMPYLDIASENAKQEGLSIRFIHSDMRNYCDPGSFDLIANLCTSFGYLDSIEEDIKVLQNIYASLAEGGRFVIEILGKEVSAARFCKEQETEYDGFKMIARSKILDDWSILECRRTIIEGDSSKEVVSYHRLYSATELKGHLKEAGFKNIKVYGSFAGAPYDNEAKSMIMIGEK